MKKINQRSLKTGLLFLMVLVISIGCQQQKPDPSQELKPIIDKLIEVWNNGNLDDLDTIIDPNFVRSVNQIPDVKGVEGLKKVVTAFRTAYPDLNLTWDNGIYAENSLAGRWVFTGTNTGAGEMQPTGKSVSIWGESIFYFADGKITREIVAYNNQAFMEQLGFTATPPAGATQ
jgi:steroid delta-isomerase-like uncharacterized protein